MALAWWIMGIIVAVLLYLVIFKFQDLMFILTLVRKNTFTIIALAIVLFFTFSLYHINSNYDVDLTSSEGVSFTGKLYWSWVKSVFSNLGSITGYAVQQDWFLNNSNVTE